jgi:hypothetical protein
MKKFIIVLMFLVTGCTFGHFLTDTSAVRISNQDSVGVWDSTMIFVVQKKVSSTYHWKKMYMWQLRHILNDSLKLTNLMIPRLAGTPTTNITLKTFATNTLYRADFNYNFRKIDSLAIAFDLNDFTLTGDTVSIKNKITKDSTSLWDKPYGSIYLPYHTSGVDMNTTNAYKTIKGLTIDNLYNVTATDSTLTIHTAGAYAVSITAAFRDTTVLSSSVYMQLFVNNTGAVNASIFCEKSTNSELGMTTITSIQKLSANDVLKLKFFSAGSSGNNRLIFYNVNFSVHKL